MLFRQIYETKASAYSYLLAAGEGGEAVLIDPVREQLDLYLQLLNELRLTLRISLDTHVHADHITASAALRDKTGCDLVMGKVSKAQGLSWTVEDQQVFGVDGIELVALHTPGHTDDSYCYRMGDRVFTGDTLLIRGTGRTDFQHGSSTDAYDSLFNILLSLPDETLVYPAHDYKGMTVSTIGEEKRHNPRLQVSSPQEYAELMASLDLPSPKQMDVAVPANLRCGS